MIYQKKIRLSVKRGKASMLKQHSQLVWYLNLQFNLENCTVVKKG